ncbi:Protein Ecm13-like [Teratosphaeria destructans]|uniref:Protein Ecm13-like n=1 Tax=Teratosphaeria destructans TaxID=418781 RepID=A0A9W7W4N4_9PEZI|nr:Protein Ecm13-like [Teratosphaeria destructans]
MSLTQTYYVASTARSKLGREASKADHNLRLLVGHANMLDQLMAELADAEMEQEAWFNLSVKKANKSEELQHIQWIDTVQEEEMEVDEDAESDDGSEYDDTEMFSIPLRKIKSPPVTVSSMEIPEEDEDEEDEDEDTIYDEDDDEDMPNLTRVTSHHSPPELTHDSDSDSEDEPTPPSPESTTMDFSEKQRRTIPTTAFYNARPSQPGLEDYIMQRAHQPQAPLIAAC